MMAVSAEEKANLTKRIIDAGGDPKEAAKFAGAESTPAEQATTPPEPTSSQPKAEGSKIPKVVSGAASSISTTKSQRIIFGVMLFATGMTILGDMLSGRTSVTDAIPRRVAAGTIAGIMLMLLAIPVPKVAASLAGVIAIASLFVNPNGQKVLEAISKIGGTPSSDERIRGGGRRTGTVPDGPPPVTPGQPS
jgi:hypothetical protein